MPFLITAYDLPQALDRRMAARQAHLEALAELKADGKILYAAALLDNADQMIGSMLVVDLTRPEIDAWFETEPYLQHNVWDRSRIAIVPCRPPVIPAKS
jgi:uncharacterized protein YciI